MKRIALLLGLLFACGHAYTQANVPVSAVVSWTLPTMTADGSPLTGGNALTAVQVFASSTAIADGSTVQPTATLAPTAATWTYTTTAPNGSTLYFRAKACNVGGCSPFSNQATKAVTVSVPGAPAGVAVTVSVVVNIAP